MLLPSDVARLVLGYLQEEGLTASTQAFIHESPNLKEYADHTTADGTIPACVFSIFGKGLTTILNEYVAAKTKESCVEVPVVMTSLWKKLDFTLNQIKSMQNSPAISACQRTRSRVAVANMARQRVLAVASSAGGPSVSVCSSVSEASAIVSPAHTSHSMLGHSTPVTYTPTHPRPTPAGPFQHIHDVSRVLNTPRDSPVQIIISENRVNPGPMSPGRRKWDTPRKRGGAAAPGGSSGPSRSASATAGSLNAEPQPEEAAADENFPQLVIQNARDKILGDRSLQEKLAENINKILSSDPIPPTSKASSSTVEEDQSIDEILGLQGEIHMSDDAIHDILEQTESDPAFQALFDLFEYNKSKLNESEAGDGDISSSPEESDTAGPSAAVNPLPNDVPGATHRDANASDTPTVRMKTGLERKTRKSTSTSLMKKTVLEPGGRACRIENSSARLLVAPSGAVDSNTKQNPPLHKKTVFVTPMDIDEPLNTPPPPLDNMESEESAAKESTSTTTISSLGAFNVQEMTLAPAGNKEQEIRQAQGHKEQLVAATSSSLTLLPDFLSAAQVGLNNSQMQIANQSPRISISSGDGSVKPAFSLSVMPGCAASTSAAVTQVPALTSLASVVAPFTATPASVCTPATLTATPAPSTTSSFLVPVGPASDSPSKAAATDSNIVSLKIIIADNQDENSSSDRALNQAISSISGDQIPTIYLSSPAKSPGGMGSTKANMDEVALAVSGLQSSNVFGSPISSGKAGAIVASPLPANSQGQQNYIIQLPLDAANPALRGAPASYFLLTDPPTADTQTRQLLLSPVASRGQTMTHNQYGGTTTSRSKGPVLILPSPANPMMQHVSVLGQNTLGKVQMDSNQLVAITNPVPVQQSEIVKPKPPTVTVKPSTTAGTKQHPVSKPVRPLPVEKDSGKAPTHRRILCFDPSAEVQPQTAKTTTAISPSSTNQPTSRSVEQTEKDNAQSATGTKPAIVGSNKPKRRVHPVRCSADLQTGGSFVKEAEKSIPPQLHHKEKDPVKNNSGKQDHSVHGQEPQRASTSRAAASQLEKKSQSGRTSKSVDRKHNHDKHGDGAKAKDPCSSRSSSSDSTLRSGTRKEKEESGRKDAADKAPAKPREGRTEKRVPPVEMPNVRANKENEMKSGAPEQQQPSERPSSTPRDTSPPAVPPTTSTPQSKTTKAPSKTSSLIKQAQVMLHDIHGLNTASTPIKRSGAGSSELSLPRTPGSGFNQEEPSDCPRTPSRPKKGRDEGTPRLIPPNTPDIPTCSPASEAGSESSINMAAHTLMILSRASIARTGTPLKDSLRQEEAGEKSPMGSKNSKKRKPSSPVSSPPAKKDRERKKLVDCFPHDLDVDKFLSSLHYDE